MNYQYNNRYKKKNSPVIIFSLIIILVLVSLSVFFLFRYVKKNKDVITKKNEIQKYYQKLFEEKNFTLIIEKIENELKADPFSVKYLMFRGYSFFLLGEEEKNIQKRNSFLYSSLIDLRKALALGVSAKNKENIFLAIGKIYYYLGENYYRLSVDYLSRALESGMVRKDLFYILGLVHSNIGSYDKSIEYFKESLKIEETDFLLLALGLTYYKYNDSDNTIKYLNRVIKVSNNPKIIEKSFFLLGEIYFNQNKISESLDCFNKVIDLNENNASAYFYRGEIFFKYNEKIKARAEWRKALLIDPSHIRALKRIY